MAQIPTKEQVEKMQAETQTAIDNKKKLQATQGKDFVPTGAGVIPEKDWQKMKAQS